jgi:NAD-dependent dihydropyrimidine dehydrogenase PreA subunit
MNKEIEMSVLRYVLVNVIGTCFRLAPWGCKVGLIEIGQPDRHSPVLVTCNYLLTVERVRRALQGVDCYLLVANSRGVNVWCAATGGLFTHHDVVSALKTSGIQERVSHRKVVLPQLAATGVEASELRARAGWEVVWGPVEASDLPGFLGRSGRKLPQEREVSFGWPRRLEMAVAWAVPVSIVVALALFFAWRAAVLPAVSLTWALASLVFLTFPLYARRLGPRVRVAGWEKVSTNGSGRDATTPVSRVPAVHLPSPGGGWGFSFGQGGLQLILWALGLLVLAGHAALSGTLSWAWLWRWGLLMLVLVILVTVDLAGMTPIYKSSTHKDRHFRVELDVDRCIGDGACVRVCPRNCFALDSERGRATMPGHSRCVRCGACIVQCPRDALYFVSPAGEVLAPETVRRYKLNLMGTRAQPKP